MTLFSIRGRVAGTSQNLLHSMARTLKVLEHVKTHDLKIQKNVMTFTVNRSLIGARLSDIEEAHLTFEKLESGLVVIDYKFKIRWFSNYALPGIAIFGLFVLTGHAVRDAFLVLGAYLVLSAQYGVRYKASWVYSILQ